MESTNSKSKWKKGSPSPNPNGRPKGTGKKVSRLRRILAQFEEMCKDDAPAIIKQSLDGKVVPDEQLKTAKWVVTTYTAIHKACVAEEETKTTRSQAAESEGNAEGADEDGGPATFTLNLVKSS